MKRFVLCLIALSALLLPSLALAQPNPATNICQLAAGATQASFTATQQIIAAPTGSKTIYINGTPTSVTSAAAIHICKVELRVNQTTGAADFSLVTGTGTNCGTGQAQLTPVWKGTASVMDKYDALFGSSPLNAPAGKAVCVKLSAAPTGAVVLINYALY